MSRHYVCDNPACRDHRPNPHDADDMLQVYLQDVEPEPPLPLLSNSQAPCNLQTTRRLVVRWPYKVPHGWSWQTIHLCDDCHTSGGQELAQQAWERMNG